jgi:hypothetical protein
MKKFLLSIVLLSASNFVFAQFFILPIPNTQEPPQLKQLIDTLEKSSETKAVASVSEDKLFSAKIWTWGYISGEMTQQDADRIAMISCNTSLEQYKTKLVGGKPLYDFGKKKCELHQFKNKIIKIPADGQIKVTSSDGNYKKIQVIDKLKSYNIAEGWVNSIITNDQYINGTALISINKTIDTALRIDVMAKNNTQDLRGIVENIRNYRRKSENIENIEISQVNQISVNNRLAYTYTYSGKLKTNNELNITYNEIIVDIEDAIVFITFWTTSINFDSKKNIYNQISTQLISYITGENLKSEENDSTPVNSKNFKSEVNKNLRFQMNLGEEWADNDIKENLQKAGVVIYKTNYSLQATVIISSIKTNIIKNPTQFLETSQNALKSMLKNHQYSDIEILNINGSKVARYEIWGTQLSNGVNLEMKYLTYIITDKENTYTVRFSTNTHNYDFQKSIYEEKMQTAHVLEPDNIFSSVKDIKVKLTAKQINEQCIKLGYIEGSSELSFCQQELLMLQK